ncbi:flagellar basal body-associated FliL family protein [Aquipuribacter sp. SD81]|uniref:flagellar basal body-associated FliL family protein n=1 Tax=Aquipuribacter sp. SD81 TaxID=3127703 RepID=UPI00301985D9
MSTVTDRTLSKGAKVPQQRGGGGGEDEAAPAKSKKKLVVVAAAVVVLLGAAAAWFFLMGPGAGGEETAEGEAEAAAEEEHAEPEPGEVLALEPVTVNLADGHYLQIGIALQAALEEGGGHGAELDGSKALDIVIADLTGKEMAELQDPAKRAEVKAHLVEEVAHAYHDHVYDIYFTTFVMQ